MAIQVMIPKEGSTESCLIVKWNYKAGDAVKIGDLICEVETEKSAFDVEAPRTGILLDIFFDEGEEVPVLTTIAVIGEHGEDYKDLIPAAGSKEDAKSPEAADELFLSREAKSPETADKLLLSPRAKKLANDKGVLISGLKGTGPEGSIIERDVKSWLSQNQPLTPAAKELAEAAGAAAPSTGNGIGGRVSAADILSSRETTGDRQVELESINKAAGSEEKSEVRESENVYKRQGFYGDKSTGMSEGEYKEVQLKGVRKVAAERLLSSMQTSAQFTLHTTANAEKLLECRSKFKNSPASMGLNNITINDMILFAVSSVLVNFNELNSTYAENIMKIYRSVNLGFAVDTPKGLLVPVIKCADKLSLKEISEIAAKLSNSCREGKAAPDDLTGGTFTVSNLGTLGIDGFTPILNTPQSGILGVGRINPRPVLKDGEVKFEQHMELSLTVNHQIIDGAPAAKFLQTLGGCLADFDLTMAL